MEFTGLIGNAIDVIRALIEKLLKQSLNLDWVIVLIIFIGRVLMEWVAHKRITQKYVSQSMSQV